MDLENRIARLVLRAEQLVCRAMDLKRRRCAPNFTACSRNWRS
jgi:hypothetical protein